MNYAIYRNATNAIAIQKGATVVLDGKPETVVWAGKIKGQPTIRVKGRWVKLDQPGLEIEAGEGCVNV